jgi:hypothetical protein
MEDYGKWMVNNLGLGLDAYKDMNLHGVGLLLGLGSGIKGGHEGVTDAGASAIHRRSEIRDPNEWAASWLPLSKARKEMNRKEKETKAAAKRKAIERKKTTCFGPRWLVPSKLE